MCDPTQETVSKNTCYCLHSRVRLVGNPVMWKLNKTTEEAWLGHFPKVHTKKFKCITEWQSCSENGSRRTTSSIRSGKQKECMSTERTMLCQLTGFEGESHRRFLCPRFPLALPPQRPHPVCLFCQNLNGGVWNSCCKTNFYRLIYS